MQRLRSSSIVVLLLLLVCPVRFSFAFWFSSSSEGSQALPPQPSSTKATSRSSSSIATTIRKSFCPTVLLLFMTTVTASTTATATAMCTSDNEQNIATTEQEIETWRQPVFLPETAKEFIKDDHLYPPEYEGHFESLILHSSEIRHRIRNLAKVIAVDYKGSRPVLLCTLKGACPFYTHLTDALQNLRQGYDMEFIRASSYEGTFSTGKVQILGELEKVCSSIKGRRVLVIEDILDTGTTLQTLVPMLEKEGSPVSVKVCTLLDKRLEESAKKKFHADYVGFSIPNHFIVGYGLDYNELYRDLKDIFVISQAGTEFDATKLHHPTNGGTCS